MVRRTVFKKKAAKALSFSEDNFQLVSSRQNRYHLSISFLGSTLWRNHMIISAKKKQQHFDAVREYIGNNYISKKVESMKNRPFDDFYGLSGDSLLETTQMIYPSYSMSSADNRRLEDLVDNIDESFSTMVLRLIDEKGLTDTKVYKKAGIDRRVFSKLRSNEDYQPSRNTAILLSMAMKLSLDETRDLLAKAGYALSHSSRSDLITEYFLTNSIYDIDLLNETLVHFGERSVSE